MKAVAHEVYTGVTCDNLNKQGGRFASIGNVVSLIPVAHFLPFELVLGGGYFIFLPGDYCDALCTARHAYIFYNTTAIRSSLW